MSETQIERVNGKLRLKPNADAPAQKAKAARRNAAAKLAAVRGASAQQKLAALLEYIEDLELRLAALEG